MTNEELGYKDLTRKQMDSLKDIYIKTRVNSMTLEDLKCFVEEVLELQVRVTVGNQEEKEIWNDMKDLFGDDFSNQIKQVVKTQPEEDICKDPKKEEFQKRLEVLEQRKNESKTDNSDMW